MNPATSLAADISPRQQGTEPRGGSWHSWKSLRPHRYSGYLAFLDGPVSWVERWLTHSPCGSGKSTQ